MTRAKQHILICVAASVCIFIIYQVVPGTDKKYLWSMATGYTSIILLTATLIIGPLNVLNKRNNPTSSNLRRDIAIWCGLIGLAHVVVGIQVHMGNMLLYFFKAVEGEEGFALRSDLFGAANYTGLAAAIILLMLLMLSNDISLRLLRPARWKSLQRWSYALFILTLGHAVMYQVIEKRTVALVLLMISIMLVAVVYQVRGFSQYRKKV
ncbi:MAG: ferric reductase-like transmembrane domain-containing protein [Bacteroidota bacterium]